MVKVFYCGVFILLANLGFVNAHYRENTLAPASLIQDTLDNVSAVAKQKINNLNRLGLTIDSIDVKLIKKNPFISVGDYLIGQSAGVFVQAPTAEPGAYQNIIVRGLSSSQFTNRDIVSNQATVFVNGIPLGIENNFAYDIQQYDYNRIGPATDYLSSINLSSIKSIEVIKDPVRLAELGPLASNGAIWITTFQGRSGDKQIAINSYYGINTKPAITPLNAQYEDLFRSRFYSKYGTIDDKLKYPAYLADSTNLNYYGNSDWHELYFNNASLYNMDLSLNGGTDRANFGFIGGYTKNAISSDATKLDRYNLLVNINMLPFEWLNVSSFINGRKMYRGRNTNIRDRYAEMAYVPDLSVPIAPNKSTYTNYRSLYNSSAVDDNITTHLQGFVKVGIDIFENLNFSTNFSLDYNEGIRDLFYPGSLMETVNYMSSYYGYTQRFLFNNKLSYYKDLNDNSSLQVTLGSDYSEDLYRYNFARAYDGPNDYIKLNVVVGDANKSDYLEPKGGLRVLRWNNREQFHLHSLYGKINYSLNSLELNGVLRWDGSSTVQPDSRWLFTPAFSAKWKIQGIEANDDIFNLKLGYSRIGKPIYNSRFALGPQYASNLGWSQDPTVSSYFGYAGISRDYNFGWVGYNLDWAYSDKYEFTIDKSFFNNNLSTSISIYQSDDKNQMALTPIPAEYGYTGQYQNGLSVRNQGVDFLINANILSSAANSLGWKTSFNVNLNRNEVTALPNSHDELLIGNNKLKVGESVDNFWLLQNQGIFSKGSDIPSSASGDVYNNNGVPFAVGDAFWKDQNNDNIINDDDKIFAGRFTPSIYGGLHNTLAYKGFDFSFSFVYALGHKALNQRASNKYNFINNESLNTLEATREIFHWAQDMDINKYPIYNVWSGTNPYRLDQDLFLEDASYLKLRSITLGYDLSNLSTVKSLIKTVRKAYLYGTANNLFTISKFSGMDPELINFNGIYDGYGLSLSRTFTIGIKLEL